MRFALIIFDCDGVLIDSEPIANRVLSAELARAGLRLHPDEVMRRFVGRTRAGCLELAAALLGRELPADFAKAWDQALFAAFAEELRPIEGVREAIAAIGARTCVASNSSRERMRVSLQAAGLAPLFGDRVFSAEVVARPKPAPDLFLHAAASMGAAPGDCAVVERTRARRRGRDRVPAHEGASRPAQGVTASDFSASASVFGRTWMKRARNRPAS